jgi:hypothetical protein
MIKFKNISEIKIDDSVRILTANLLYEFYVDRLINYINTNATIYNIRSDNSIEILTYNNELWYYPISYLQFEDQSDCIKEHQILPYRKVIVYKDLQYISFSKINLEVMNYFNSKK